MFTSKWMTGIALKEAGLCCFTRSGHTVHVHMNELIVVRHGGLTLKKLQIFTESTHLHGWGDLKHIIAYPVSLGFHLRTRSLSGKQKAPKPQTIRERLHNAHLAAGLDIWLLFNPQKKKNQQGFGVILLAWCFLSPCRLEDKCERRHSDPPAEESPAPPQHILIVKWIAVASWWLVGWSCFSHWRAGLEILPEVWAKTTIERQCHYKLPSHSLLSSSPWSILAVTNFPISYFSILVLHYLCDFYSFLFCFLLISSPFYPSLPHLPVSANSFCSYQKNVVFSSFYTAWTSCSCRAYSCHTIMERGEGIKNKEETESWTSKQQQFV